jgi:hypothetical protein
VILERLQAFIVEPAEAPPHRFRIDVQRGGDRRRRTRMGQLLDGCPLLRRQITQA